MLHIAGRMPFHSTKAMGWPTTIGKINPTRAKGSANRLRLTHRAMKNAHKKPVNGGMYQIAMPRICHFVQ